MTRLQTGEDSANAQRCRTRRYGVTCGPMNLPVNVRSNLKPYDIQEQS